MRENRPYGSEGGVAERRSLPLSWMRPLIWVSKSMDKLAEALTELGHPVSGDTVARELVKLGFSRQYNRKADEGSKHPDRNAQFEHINAKVVAAQAKGQPVISVDTKKKELVGNFKYGGSDYRAKGQPTRVNVHDFTDKDLGKAVPYGVYDVAANAGFVVLAEPSSAWTSALRRTRPGSPCNRSGAGSSAWGASATPIWPG